MDREGLFVGQRDADAIRRTTGAISISLLLKIIAHYRNYVVYSYYIH